MGTGTAVERKVVEVCANDEWYRVFGPLGDFAGLEDYTGEISSEYLNRALNAMANDPRLRLCEVRPAVGPRRMCHVWNGTNFSYTAGAIGAFEKMTAAERAAMDDAHSRAMEAVQRIYGR